MQLSTHDLSRKPAGQRNFWTATLLATLLASASLSTPCRGESFPVLAGDFRRADANGDELQDVSDAVTILTHLFLGGELDCLDAANVDASLAIDVTDSIYLMVFLFLGGEAPPAPFPGCGRDSGFLGCAKPQCADPVWLARPDGCRQCERCNAPGLEEVVDGLEADGVTVLDSGTDNVPVCLACSVCPSGRYYLVLVPEDEQPLLITQGWVPAAQVGLDRDEG